MYIKIAVLISYFLIVLGIGFIARTRWKSTPETYFLADRKLGTLILLGTMVATNFSAFTVFGTSGAGYRDGYAFFPIMGFGTGFMALTFWIIGRKIRQAGKEHNIVTPPELVKNLYQSPFLSLIFALVMIIFTIPYLALQPMAAGYALEALLGLPYFYGCLVVTGIILVYTLRGGMRAVAWTDLFQGSVMFILLVAALIMVAGHHGGFVEANQKVLASNPELFSRPGGLGKYSPGIWFSFIVLWFFCDPMFPQLFQRFFSAKNDRSISRIMILYPLVCTVVFFMPIAVGVLGRLSFPGLVGKQADRILPLVLTSISGDFMAALVIAAGLAALMSTMDSQLLTLSSIFTRDVLPLVKKSQSETSVAGRVFVILLSLAGLALAYKPPATILQIATQTFTGLAALFPTVIFGLYFKRVYPLAAILSILCGEGALIGFYIKLLATNTFLPVIWVMMITFAVYLITHAIMLWRENALQIHLPQWLYDRYVWILLGIFILAMDFWAWGKTDPLFWGIPLWVGYFVVLSALQTIVMVSLMRREFNRQYLPAKHHRSGG
ncbi:MAG: sodium:solute symporter family protein [Deltaproteobacteria bacterium]|jgi:SSS family solute:Na+ symporter|nr:sodium:solute symporter family protein [Deltaproteobacteria bacterium]